MTILEAIKSGKEVQTRNGKKARILSTDVKNPEYPIVAVIMWKNGKEIPYSYTADGRFNEEVMYGDLDLIIKPKKVTKWFNVYNYRGVLMLSDCVFNSKEEALQNINLHSVEDGDYYIDTKSFEI